jgi:hypothetical protein
VPKATPLLLTIVTTLYSQAAKGLSRAGNQAGNRSYFIQLLLQQVIGSQSSQFGLELDNSDRFGDDFILATQY